MRKFTIAASMVLLLSAIAMAVDRAEQRQQADTARHAMTRPDEIAWGPAPAKLPPGAQFAILDGDPSQPGVPFTIRVKVPDGFSVPPHTHPTDEHLTVISGTMLLGMGGTFDRAKLRELPAGSYAALRKEQPHFNRYKGESIIQLHGIGPYDIRYVDPADDPSQGRKPKVN